jgi:hypothetical protein
LLKKTPIIKVQAAPIPVQTAQAVPVVKDNHNNISLITIEIKEIIVTNILKG